jgi:primosomal protein N'
MIAHVIPVVRLRRNTSWWSYKLPNHLTCQPGSLVEIEFRGRPVLGVVWSVDNADPTLQEKKLLDVQAVHTCHPLLRAPHRAFVEWMAEYGLCSLSTALYQWLPVALRKAPLSPSIRTALSEYDTWLTGLPLTHHLPAQEIVLTPARRPYLHDQLRRKYGDACAEIFADPSASRELREWLKIARGEVRIGIGRERALYAPWANLHRVTIIDPEDVTYYHEQIPYIWLTEAAARLADRFRARLTLLSYLPQSCLNELCQGWLGNAGQAKQVVTQSRFPYRPDAGGMVEITDLRHQPLLNDRLLQQINACLQTDRRVLVLYNARDRISGKGSLYPGVETVRKRILARLNLDGRESPAAELLLCDTRTMLYRPWDRVGLTVLLCSDALLAENAFADVLHGWADLAKLLHYPVPLHIQTHQPDHPLHQRLLHDTFADYLLQKVREQKEVALHPFAEQVVLAYPSLSPAPSATAVADSLAPPTAVLQVQERLRGLPLDGWQTSHPFLAKRGRNTYWHVLLYASRGARVPISLRNLTTSLASPWKIQRNPGYIL